MAINSCSINAFTINSLACRRRSFGPPIPPQPPVDGGQVQHVRYQNWRDRREEAEDYNLESFNISVSVSLGGQTFAPVTIENTPLSHTITPMISVTNFNAEHSMTTSVMLNNLKLSRIKSQEERT